MSAMIISLGRHHVEVRSKAFGGACKRGYRAGLGGVPITSCPYADLRTWQGSVTFSRAFMMYWEKGCALGLADRSRIRSK